jgi:hypothetical protein
MKSFLKIIGLLLVILMAINLSLNAQRGMRGMMMDSTRIYRMGRGMDMGMKPDTMMIRGMRQRMPQMQRNRMGQFIYPMYEMRRPAPGMRNADRGMRWMGPGMERQAMYMGHMHPGMGMRYQATRMRGSAMDMRQPSKGMRVIENIPNLTDKQKKDIADLRLKQQEEMKKLRDEAQVKMTSLRESQRGKVISLLTEEQKKWVEKNSIKPSAK